MFSVRKLEKQEINRRISTDPTVFIEEEEARYRGEIEQLCALLEQRRCRQIMLLSGPSSSGKTTTAHLLCDHLRMRGADVHVVSLDDFYRGRGLAPQLPDGSYDYESPLALDLERLELCMQQLVRDGETLLPQYSFEKGRPLDEQIPLKISAQSIVIFEGIHALQPAIGTHLPQENLTRLFINTLSPIYDDGKKLLARRDIPLTRRLLRDERFRNSPPDNTMHMWQQVMRGESLYLFPYTKEVNAVIDTTHAYEPCILGHELLPRLEQIPATSPYRRDADLLAEKLRKFAKLPPSMLPERSLLREFLG